MRLFNLKSVQFDQIISDAQNWLRETIGSSKAINKSTVFGQLITVIAAIAQNIFLYIEDALVEQNKYTAQRKKSIYGLAAQSGYQPSYGKAAGVWVKFIPKSNNNRLTDVIVPNHSMMICSANGLYYNLVLERDAVVLKPNGGLADKYFYAVQGKFETQRFVSTGGRMYVQNIKFIGYIDTDHLEVRVNGELWKKEASLYDMAPNAKSYFLRYNPVDGLDIIFGTSTYGRPLHKGDTIIVSYLLHDGAVGNVDVQESSYFVFASKLTDTSSMELDANTIYDIKFASEDAVSAGSNSESLLQVKNMIGFNSRSMTLVDSNSYKAFLNRYSFVGYNRTWSEPGSMVINSMVMRNYRINMDKGSDYFNLTPEDFNLTNLQKSQIKNSLSVSGMQIAGTVYNLLDIELCKYALYVYVKLIDDESDHTIVSNKIRNAVGEFFGDVQSDNYVPKSDVINAILENVPEVDGVNCYFLSEKNETALQVGHYENKIRKYIPSKGTWEITKETVQIYPGENPMLGLDAHGNILIDDDYQFPVLMGGWDWVNKEGQEVSVVNPLTIIFE